MAKRLAIVIDDYDVAEQTFVKRHIEELRNGDTAVICRKKSVASFGPKPVLYYHKRSYRTTGLLGIGSQFLMGGNIKRLASFLKQNDVGCMLAEFGYSGLLIHREAAKLGIPLYCYFRGADASRWLTSEKYRRRLRDMMSNLHGIFSVSKFLVENLEKYGIHHPSTNIVPSGADTEWFRPGDKDENLIVSVGRFVPKKGHQYTIDAFSRLSGEFPNLRLEMVGTGETLETCRECVVARGLEKRVKFHGLKNHASIRDLLAQSAIFMQHSITDSNSETEGMPTSIQEAMSSGNVVITTRHAGIPEHIEEGRNGFMVGEQDIESYTSKLRRVLSHKPLGLQIASNARRYAERNLDYRISLKKIDKILSSHLDRGN